MDLAAYWEAVYQSKAPSLATRGQRSTRASASLSTMSTTYSIGELASAVDLPASTIRYYEREGLLEPAGRSESNYRLYGEQSLDRLTFIRAAQASGLALDDIKRVMALRAGRAEACPDVQQLLERRLADTEARLAQLRRVRAVLRSSLSACKESAPTGRCQTIDGLDRRARLIRGAAKPAAQKKSRKRKP